MRLRLTINRNGLPAANILWNVPDTNSTQAYTVSRLLEDVNHVVPLEAEHWGLEHYVVEVDGFECLHFSPVMQALKEDDHVSIRPLMTAEERARTLTGRHQISGDGRHLVDGVPFGRPYLRHPNRPAVRIPPRKRRRLDDADTEAEGEPLGLLTANGEGSPQQAEASLLTNGDAVTGAERQPRAKSHPKTVQFTQPEAEGEDDDDSDEDDDDFAPEEQQDDEDVAMDDDSDSDDEGSDSSSASDTSSDSDSNSSSSGSESESDASSPPEVRSSKGDSREITQKLSEPPMHVAPGDGFSLTRSRNSRRTRTNRLRHFKDAGKLHADAGLKDLKEYESAKEYQEPKPSKPFSTYSGKRKHVEEEMTDDIAKTVTEYVVEDVVEDFTDLEQRKHELMARFGKETSSVMAQPEEVSQGPAAAQKTASPKRSLDEEQLAKPETSRKRLRPDTTAIGRILARQAMPRAKKPSKDKQVVEEPQEPEGASDPDFWKSKINVSAFECWDEEFELSAPPFPFQQHWDPASKHMREKAEKKRQKKGGRNKRESVAAEEEEEETIILDYDDPPTNGNPDSEINAAIEDQLRQDVATAAQADLPHPPEDISTLPFLTAADIKQGAVVVCRFFTVNPVTIQPEISDYKTAVVEQEGDSGNGAGTFRLKIAARDLPKKEVKFDRKGNRIYGAADNLFMEDDDEEDGLWEGQFGELIEAKLLKAA